MKGVSNDGVSRTPGLGHGDAGHERQVSNNEGCLLEEWRVSQKGVSRTPGLEGVSNKGPATPTQSSYR